MSILVTGGAGFLGSHVAVELLEADYDVVVADNYVNSVPKAIGRVEEITGKKIKTYGADVSSDEELDRIFTENEIEAVIHCAGLKAVGESVEKPLLYYKVNLETAIATLQAMERHGVRGFVFSSSATVYGENCPVPYTEDMPAGGCTNPYGWTKYMIERIAIDAAKTGKIDAVLLRYFNPIGAHPSGLIGEDPAGIPNNLMPYISQVAVGRREKLSIFGDDYPTPDGTGVRDYIHVVDLAKGHVLAIEYMKEHRGYEIINLGTGRGTSVLELVHAFERVNNVPIPHVITERRAGDLAEVWAVADKARRLLGWTAELTVEDMCRDSYNWQKKNPNGYGN
ncbi:MAG: UDP-glucose 4-epimerase GalE [Oscillospiraceae bacterium]|nr:UDP-glucose 4-epimerase GalE [Oscillospiraceae bacterium]